MKSVNAAVFNVLFCERPVSFSAREKAMVCLETDAKPVCVHLLNFITWSSKQ